MIISDAGSSSTKWIHTPSNKIWKTAGYNPNYHEDKLLEESLESLSSMKEFCSGELFYYGSGCLKDPGRTHVLNTLKNHFPSMHISVESDLLGAARAVMGTHPEFVGILGTGSSLSYVEKDEISVCPALGYPLGDEASGYDLSRRVLRSYFGGICAESDAKWIKEILIQRKFDHYGELDFHDSSNWILGSLWREIVEFKDTELVQFAIQDALRGFFSSQFPYFSKKEEKNISFVGSVAKSIENELRTFFNYRGFKVRKVLQDPLKSLQKFHSS